MGQRAAVFSAVLRFEGVAMMHRLGHGLAGAALLALTWGGGAGAASGETLTGMFTYMADAATITLCGGDGRLPVAMEGDYKALEAAYLKERRQPGDALLVSVEGAVAPRPSAEPSGPPQPALVVARFVGIWPRETCGTPLADSPLRNTYWRLVRLRNMPVRVAERQREPYLVLALNQQRVSGHDGCNRLIGRFELNGDGLRFRDMAATMMACPDDVDRRFRQALGQVERYRISGSHLEMLDAAGAAVARFEAVALR
ncbi:MAG TPA: META domain-containing protein [Methylomirabilota bacterium]|nr:META domain-containing protein [Methylomirabilota bacterium]